MTFQQKQQLLNCFEGFLRILWRNVRADVRRFQWLISTCIHQLRATHAPELAASLIVHFRLPDIQTACLSDFSAAVSLPKSVYFVRSSSCFQLLLEFWGAFFFSLSLVPHLPTLHLHSGSIVTSQRVRCWQEWEKSCST